MRFVLAVLCHDGMVGDDGNLSLTTIFSRINCGSFPHIHPRMVLACSLAIPPASKLESVHISADLIDPDGRVLNRIMNDARILVGTLDDLDTFSFTTELLNLIFPDSGDYQISIFIDDILAHAVHLSLRPMTRALAF